VSLSWSASSGATSYHVKRALTSGGPYSQVGAPTASSYTDTSLTDGTTYYYVVSALDSAGESANSAQVNSVPVAPTTSQTANACGMQLGTSPIIFCDTFDAPAGTGTRAGDLNGNVWGASRASGYVNLGAGWYNLWNPVAIALCDGTTPTVIAPADLQICNGQLREAVNDNNTGVFDNGAVTSLAFYPKQPFDFANRTGTVSFDVSNDTDGNHSVWPEFWMSDLPVPDPFTHFNSWVAVPANGFGLRFANSAPAGAQGECPNANNLSVYRWTVDSVVVSRAYMEEDNDFQGTNYGTSTGMKLTLLDCVIESTGPGNMNHVEVRVSQNQIDVYATDAGVLATPTTLRHIASITGANLTFTRGLIWLEDAHYNADKSNDPNRPTLHNHTFAWDNVAFDGPFTQRDFTFDVPDALVVQPNTNGSANLGYLSQPNATATFAVAGIPANFNLAAAARVLFSFNSENRPNPTALTVVVNGHSQSVPWPYPDQTIYSWRTFAVAIPLSDLVAGTNTVQLGSDVAEVFSNVDIVLGDVAGGVPVLPGSTQTYP